MATTESKMVLDNHTITIWFFIGDKKDLNAFTGDWTHPDQLQRFMPPQKYYLFQPMICFHEIIPENFKQIPHISSRRKSKLQLYQHKLKQNKRKHQTWDIKLVFLKKVLQNFQGANIDGIIINSSATESNIEQSTQLTPEAPTHHSMRLIPKINNKERKHIAVQSLMKYKQLVYNHIITNLIIKIN